jgi:hypothetical protein
MSAIAASPKVKNLCLMLPPFPMAVGRVGWEDGRRAFSIALNYRWRAWSTRYRQALPYS